MSSKYFMAYKSMAHILKVKADLANATLCGIDNRLPDATGPRRSLI